MFATRTARRLLLASLFALAACGGDDAGDGTDTDTGAADTGTSDAGADATDAGQGDTTVGDTTDRDTGSTDAGGDVAMDAEADADPMGPVPSTPEALSATGPWTVGYQVLETTYPDPVNGDDRPIDVWVWYPTEDTDGRAPQYLRAGAATDGPESVLREAAIAPVTDAPVLVFSHGHRVFPAASVYILEHFASHGWLVVAPEHTGDTTSLEDERTTDIYWQRGADISAALDFVLADGGVFDGLASDRIIGGGHSFGGYTMAMVNGAELDLEGLDAWCASDDGRANFCGNYDADRRARLAEGTFDARVLGGLWMAPGDRHKFGDAGLQSADVPVFLMTADNDTRTGADAQPYWDGIEGHDADAWWLELTNAGHAHFTDVCALGAGDDEGCGADDVAPTPAFTAVRGYALAFARWVVDGDEDARAIIEVGAITNEAVGSVVAR